MTGFELGAEEPLYLLVRIITVPVPAAGRSVLTLDITQKGWQSGAKAHVPHGITNEHQRRFRGPRHDARQFKDEQFRAPTYVLFFRVECYFRSEAFVLHVSILAAPSMQYGLTVLLIHVSAVGYQHCLWAYPFQFPWRLVLTAITDDRPS